MLRLFPKRRHADPVIDAQAHFRPGATAVHPYFPPADDAENPRPRHIAEAPGQVLVEALASILGLDLEVPHPMAPTPVFPCRVAARGGDFAPGSPGLVLWHVDSRCKALFLQ
jgi:hypothetical protein